MRVRIDSAIGLVFLTIATLPSSFGQAPINRAAHGEHGQGGYYYQETWDLTVVDAAGIYVPYMGGHNHMVDRFRSLNRVFLTNPNGPGPFDEDCYCIISVPVDLPLLWWNFQMRWE